MKWFNGEMQRASQIISENFKQFNAINSEMIKRIAKITKPILDLKIDVNFSKFYQNIAELTQQYSTFFKECKDITIRFKSICIEIGYPPHVDLSFDEMKVIITAYDEHGKEAIKDEIDQFFTLKFNNGVIDELLNTWKSKEILSKRVELIQDAIDAHKNEKYNLSVPIFFSQIEGLVAKVHNHEGRMPEYRLKKYIVDLFSTDSIYSFDDVVKNYYFTIILASFEHNQPLKSYLSRHAILHGADVNYGTKQNSLKCILLFDHFVNSLEKKHKELSNQKQEINS